MRTLSNVSLNLQQIDKGLQVAQTSLASGNTASSVDEVNHLLALRNQTSSLIDKLYALLEQVQSQQITNPGQIQDIRQRIDELQRLYVEYSIEIDELDSEITPRTVLLNIATSNSTVAIEEPIQIDGSLQTRNGTILAQRNITITWGRNTATVLSDVNGSFTTTIVFPPGYSSGFTFIDASFQPTGVDATHYTSTKASTVVQVIYPPTRIESEISPPSPLPLDSVSVNGSLTTLAGKPLDNRSLTFRLDNSPIGNVTSEVTGNFLFTFQLPGTIADGKHTLQVLFNPVAEVLAPSNSTLSFDVQRENATIRTGTAPANVLSGTGFTVVGTITFNNTIGNPGTLSGNATALLDGRPFASSRIGEDGHFSLTIPIPLGSNFGTHSIEIRYVPNDPRVDTAIEIIQIHIYDTPILVALPAVIAFGAFFARRQRGARARRLTTQLITETQGEPTIAIPEITSTLIKTIPVDWKDAFRAIDAEENTTRRIIMCYRVAQTFVSTQLNERRRESETHWEFYHHVVRLKPWTENDLRTLVVLFELAEYSPFKLAVSQGAQAEEGLKNLRDGKWT
jgi:hypothetical protein